jgi:hypothetical protein
MMGDTIPPVHVEKESTKYMQSISGLDQYFLQRKPA